MRIALIQPDDAPDGKAAILPWLENALDQVAGAQVVIWPELALCGYSDPQRIRQQSLTPGGDTLQRISNLARQRGQSLIFGYAEQSGEQRYNSMCAISAQGEWLANYRKTHLWSGYESALFAPGDQAETFTLAGITFGMLICYDLDFPELSRQYAQRGVDCLLCISATSPGYDMIPLQVAPTRAYENGCFVVFANRGDNGGDFPCIGMSRLLAPGGRALDELVGAGAGVVTGEIDQAAIRDWRQLHPGLDDCRHDLYPLADH